MAQESVRQGRDIASGRWKEGGEMTSGDIQVGMILKLKRKRQAAYGESCQFVTVTGFMFRSGYSTPYVQSGTAFYKPSDFARFVGWEETEHLVNKPLV